MKISDFNELFSQDGYWRYKRAEKKIVHGQIYENQGCRNGELDYPALG